MGLFTVDASDEDFEEIVLNSKEPVLVDFWAPWCGPCKSIGPSLEKLAEEYNGKVKIVKINIDENPETAAKFSVRSIPYLLTFLDGKVQKTALGAQSPGKLKEMIEDLQW